MMMIPTTAAIMIPIMIMSAVMLMVLTILIIITVMRKIIKIMITSMSIIIATRERETTKNYKSYSLLVIKHIAS